MYINQKEFENYKITCGFACLLMVLSYRGKDFDREKINNSLVKLNGYIDGIGWKHSAIARVLTNYNLPSYNREFTLPDGDRDLIDQGILVIKDNLTKGNFVITSVRRNFDPESKTLHLVLITKLEGDNFIIQDPDYEFGGENMEISIERFKDAWRGLCIISETI